eukprot:Em0024g477a
MNPAGPARFELSLNQLLPGPCASTIFFGSELQARPMPEKDSWEKLQALTSAGIAPNNNETWELIQSKHPKGPPPIPPAPSTPPIPILSKDFNIAMVLRSFPKSTACGPSGLRIQHLLDTAEVPLQFPISSSLRDIVNLLASGKVPVSVSRHLAGGSLTALVKGKPGLPPDIRPIAVGEALRRLTGKCLCAVLKSKASEFFAPFQFGVACPAGAEKGIHGLRHCIEEHWEEENFVVLKIDMCNAFNLVSRQALLDECAFHFPDLLPWASWCYGQQPLLQHPLGTVTSEVGVQQGDPLGPMFFSLVLHKLVTAIATDEDTAKLLFHAWYLDDGVVAGRKQSVLHALTIIQELGPPLGLVINPSKWYLSAVAVTPTSNKVCGLNGTDTSNAAVLPMTQLGISISVVLLGKSQIVMVTLQSIFKPVYNPLYCPKTAKELRMALKKPGVDVNARNIGQSLKDIRQDGLRIRDEIFAKATFQLCTRSEGHPGIEHTCVLPRPPGSQGLQGTGFGGDHTAKEETKTVQWKEQQQHTAVILSVGLSPSIFPPHGPVVQRIHKMERVIYCQVYGACCRGKLMTQCPSTARPLLYFLFPNLLSSRKGTFFEGSHLEILQVLRLLHQWSTKTPLGKAQDEVKVASATAVDWYNFIRDICIQYFIDHPAVIGGPGKGTATPVPPDYSCFSLGSWLFHSCRSCLREGASSSDTTESSNHDQPVHGIARNMTLKVTLASVDHQDKEERKEHQAAQEHQDQKAPPDPKVSPAQLVLADPRALKVTLASVDHQDKEERKEHQAAQEHQNQKVL